MLLRSGGLDCFYIDESGTDGWHVATAVRVPLLKSVAEDWTFVWPEYLDKADQWRKTLAKSHDIRRYTELHAFKIINRKDLMHKTNRNLSVEEAFNLYSDAVKQISFLPKNSIVTVAAAPNAQIFGKKGIEACLIGLFQRLRTHCYSKDEQTNGLMFFDEGHDEYTSYYRRACKYLPTGSSYGEPRNLPLDMFVKDGNIKKSHQSLFIQIADLVSYAALQKLRHEANLLNAKRVERNHHTLYDLVNPAVINFAASTKRKDGIVVFKE